MLIAIAPVLGNRSDLFRIDLIANGKHQLQIFMFRQGSYNSAKDIQPAIHYRPH